MVGNHDANLGAQESAPAVSGGERRATPEGNQETSVTDGHLGTVLALFKHLGELDAEIDFEPSFKVAHGRLFENRFLFGVRRRATGGDLDERVAAICDRMGMPHQLLESFRRTLPDANHVYFGVEKDEQTLILKAYLEYRDRIEEEIAGGKSAGRSFTLFTGFKWDTSSPARQAITRYAWYPSLSVPDMLERLRMCIEPGRNGELLKSIGEVIRRASERIACGDIQYLEVSEEGNPRGSFDINIYKSGLRLEELYPYLSGLLRHYAISSNRIESLYQKIRTERFGHLAGGVDRQNKEFMTVYFGARRIHSSQLRSARIVAADHAHSVG